MDQQELRQWEARCIQEEPPACRAGCPLNIDARTFVLAMAKGDLDAGRAVLEKTMPLAAVTARLCEAPCESFCIRENLGGAIAIGALENVCIRETRPKGRLLRLPARPKKVAVFGSGPSSLAVAFDLAKKGYPIIVYHLGEKPGGWLLDLPEDKLPPAVLQEELDRLGSLHVTFSPVSSLNADLVANSPADAVYVGQDDALSSDLLALLDSPDSETMALSRPGWFTGGLPDRAHRFISALSQGRGAAVSMDRYLQNASLTASRVPLRHGQTNLYTRTDDFVAAPRVAPADPAGFTPDEARQEAGRCLDCQCLECVRHCVYLAEHDGYPKTYARRVFNNSAIVQGMRQANRFINSCSLCGQCETLCPNDFSMAGLCLDARRQMVRENRMPPSAHWFALEEMRAAGGEQAALIRHAPGLENSRAIFFPGCQLAGIRPEQTLALYDRLCQSEPATGIWLDCCGAPAHWSGRVEEFSAWAARLEQQWIDLGRPLVVTACSTCLAMFREHLPQLQAVSVWTRLKNVTGRAAAGALALSDPCTSRHDAETRQAVRLLLADLGQPLAELPMSGELTECCGFGGLMDNANPGLARKVAENRVRQSAADFLTYCAMCRDQLAKTGKPVLHVLDLLFPDLAHDATEAPVGISVRRFNRRRLKNEVLARYGQEGMADLPWTGLKLTIADQVARQLEERRILEDDLRQVLYLSRRKQQGFRHPDGRVMASARIGEVTFWVEYREADGVADVLCAWSHRMQIIGGQS